MEIGNIKGIGAKEIRKKRKKGTEERGEWSEMEGLGRSDEETGLDRRKDRKKVWRKFLYFYPQYPILLIFFSFPLSSIFPHLRLSEPGEVWMS
jgi:hypothetical protein